MHDSRTSDQRRQPWLPFPDHPPPDDEGILVRTWWELDVARRGADVAACDAEVITDDRRRALEVMRGER